MFHVSDVFEDFLYISPNAAAKNLLIELNTKRKGVLDPTIQFIMETINGEPSDPMKKDGALHMLGALAKKLTKVVYSTEHVAHQCNSRCSLAILLDRNSYARFGEFCLHQCCHSCF